MASIFSFGFEDDNAEDYDGSYTCRDSMAAAQKEPQASVPKPQLHSLEDLVCLPKISLQGTVEDQISPNPNFFHRK